jgi:hypothetical protein
MKSKKNYSASGALKKAVSKGKQNPPAKKQADSHVKMYKERERQIRVEANKRIDKKEFALDYYDDEGVVNKSSGDKDRSKESDFHGYIPGSRGVTKKVEPKKEYKITREKFDSEDKKTTAEYKRKKYGK